MLNWNEPSIRFYRALGAVGMDEWTTFRLDGAALDRLAGRVRDRGAGQDRPVDGG